MKLKFNLPKVLILLFLILMVTNPQASYQGASTGLLLWFHNVLPNLLPFIIISNLMIKLEITKQLSQVLYPLFGRLLGVSRNGCYPILFGFLSGIPMGAKSTADLLADGKISKAEGQFILSLCNNASPMFIIGYITLNQLQLSHMKYHLFIIIYLSAIISALLYRSLAHKIAKLTARPFVQEDYKISITQEYSKKFTFEILDNSIMNSFEVVTKIGGYIILFSILAQITNTIVPEMGVIKPLLIGILEITTGVNQIAQYPFITNYIKIVLVVVLTSFGGLSGLAQTKSVLGNTGLSLGSYLIVKLMHVIISTLIITLYVQFLL